MFTSSIVNVKPVSNSLWKAMFIHNNVLTWSHKTRMHSGIEWHVKSQELTLQHALPSNVAQSSTTSLHFVKTVIELGLTGLADLNVRLYYKRLPFASCMKTSSLWTWSNILTKSENISYTAGHDQVFNHCGSCDKGERVPHRCTDASRLPK